MSTTQTDTIDIPLELHDMSSFTRAKEFGRDMAKKVLDVCSTKKGDKVQYDKELLAAYTRILAARVADPEDIAKCLKAIKTETESFFAKKREAEARESNKAKRKGRLNMNDSYDASDMSDEASTDAEGPAQEPANEEVEAQREVVEEKLVELDMSELMRRAEIDRVARAKEAEERRLEEEAELKRQRERLEVQKAVLERQRQVSKEIPEGFEIISRKPKAKGRR